MALNPQVCTSKEKKQHTLHPSIHLTKPIMWQEIVGEYGPCGDQSHFSQRAPPNNWVACKHALKHKIQPLPYHDPMHMDAKRTKALGLNSCKQCDRASNAEKQRKSNREANKDRERREKAEEEFHEFEDRMIAEGKEV
jgi:hypothetical protein